MSNWALVCPGSVSLGRKIRSRPSSLIRTSHKIWLYPSTNTAAIGNRRRTLNRHKSCFDILLGLTYLVSSLIGLVRLSSLESNSIPTPTFSNIYTVIVIDIPIRLIRSDPILTPLVVGEFGDEGLESGQGIPCHPLKLAGNLQAVPSRATAGQVVKLGKRFRQTSRQEWVMFRLRVPSNQ